MKCECFLQYDGECPSPAECFPGKRPLTPTERSLARLARIRERGGKVLNIRVCAGALQRLEALKAAHGCTMQDVIEGLLLGNIQPNRSGLSPDERELAVRQ